MLSSSSSLPPLRLDSVLVEVAIQRIHCDSNIDLCHLFLFLAKNLSLKFKSYNLHPILSFDSCLPGRSNFLFIT